MQKDICEDFLNRLDDLIHDEIDNRLGVVTIPQFKLQKELMEEALAEWLFKKFLEENK